ncbi:MAG TPA: class I SAM-dependent methyltransferase [Pirellulales bacterium]|nr:class I SAM-dependent methyltransferase [Pirellulales bacterium]
MVFGPAWQTARNIELNSLTETRPDAARAQVRAAAERLLADLARGERLTSGWNDEPLSFALVRTAMDQCVSRLAETGLWGRDNQPLSNEFWAIAGKILSRGPMQVRARTKPRGYAGDHELFAWICDGLDTPDPLGRQFDRYFQQQAAVESVRARTDQIAAAIATRCFRIDGAGEPFRVASVGSGPAIDIERAAKLLNESQRRRLAVTLLDLDAEALEHGRERLGGWLHEEQLTLVRDNLYRLADKPAAAAPLAGADVLVCAGFFDYLADEPAKTLLGLFWRHLAPGGMLLVGNFAPHCPTRAFMEWIGNWYLIYRRADELARLAEQAGIPAPCVRIGAERMGIDLFLCATKDCRGFTNS